MPYSEFVSGLITAGFLVCSGFFLKYWARIREDLFLAFAVAFAILALSQALTTLLGLPLEERSYIYLLRLLAFIIVIVGILRKNVSNRERMGK